MKNKMAKSKKFKTAKLIRATARRGSCESTQICRGTFAVFAQFLMPMRNKKMFDRENEGQSDLAQYIRNGVIRWQISKSVKDITLSCARFPHYLHFIFLTLKM